jgi:hypothetical protein
MREGEMKKHAIYIIPIITCLIGAIASGVITHYFSQIEKKQLLVQTELNKRKAFYQKMDIYLNGSYAAFLNQIQARDRLVEMLRINHSPLPDLEYEPLFRKFYPLMNADEKFICNLMKGITKTLHGYNSDMVKLLKNNPEYQNDLIEFKMLQDHIDLWNSKFIETIGKEREDVCLVYVGVAENKQFPNSINDKVKEILNEIEQSSMGK